MLEKELEYMKASKSSIEHLADIVFRTKTIVRYESGSMPMAIPAGGFREESGRYHKESEERVEIK